MPTMGDLTTASSIWLAAAVGAACGVHHFALAGTAALLSLIILHAFAATACVVEEEVARTPQLAGRLENAKFFTFWRKAVATSAAASRVL